MLACATARRPYTATFPWGESETRPSAEAGGALFAAQLARTTISPSRRLSRMPSLYRTRAMSTAAPWLCRTGGWHARPPPAAALVVAAPSGRSGHGFSSLARLARPSPRIQSDMRLQCVSRRGRALRPWHRPSRPRTPPRAALCAPGQVQQRLLSACGMLQRPRAMKEPTVSNGTRESDDREATQTGRGLAVNDKHQHYHDHSH